MKDEMFFQFMHRDDVIALLEVNLNNGSISRIGNISNMELFPVGASDCKSLNDWWEQRAVPETQGKIRDIIEKHNYPNTQSLLVDNLGLSLMDHYWIKPAGMDISWKNVNLFENDFRDLYDEFEVESEKTFSNEKIPEYSAGASSQGELLKKWIIKEDGTRCLIKANANESCQQSINEVIACKIHELQGFKEYVSYGLTKIRIDGIEEIGCSCECFTSSRLEFVSGYAISKMKKKPNDISEFDFFIKICSENGLDENYVRNFMEYQVLSDFCITNTDRHFNNFGVLRDTETLKFVSMAPIFDSGNSMFWNSRPIRNEEAALEIASNSFKKREHELLKYVKNKRCFDCSKVPGDDILYKLLSNCRLPEEDINAIITGFHHKVSLLEKFQNNIPIRRWKPYSKIK